MKCIILNEKTREGTAFNVSDLAKHLSKLKDNRDKRGKVYDLGSLLAMIVVARLSGQDKPQDIFEWLRHRAKGFGELFKLKENRTPCLNTIRTILSEVVQADELEKVLKGYLLEHYGCRDSKLICIDGKTMRGTIPKGSCQGVHLLSAYLPEGIVLKQIEVGNKENEISACPKLLKELDLKNKVVCADAMQTQRKFCLQILASGGDYLLQAKDNQPTLLSDIAQFFVPPRKAAGWHIESLPYTKAKTISKGHGRIEKRTLTLMVDTEQFIDWPGLVQVFKLERYTKEVRTGIETSETSYGLTSCSSSEADADQLLEWTRQYWEIENGLHYRRDVTLKEDATRTAVPKLAQTISSLNNFVVGLVKKLGYENLASARRYFDASIAEQLFA